MNFAVYDDVFCDGIPHEILVKSALAAFDLQVFKSEILRRGSAFGDGYVVENVTAAGAILDGYVIDLR